MWHSLALNWLFYLKKDVKNLVGALAGLSKGGTRDAFKIKCFDVVLGE
jgi:hypothetical protein